MSAIDDVVRIAFYGDEGFLISSENTATSDEALEIFLGGITRGELPDNVRRVSIFSRNRPFRRITFDMQ